MIQSQASPGRDVNEGNSLVMHAASFFGSVSPLQLSSSSLSAPIPHHIDPSIYKTED